MNPLSGPLTLSDREAIAATAAMLAPLGNIPGCVDLSAKLSCIAQTTRPSAPQFHDAIEAGTAVRRALLVETSMDRWADEVESFGADVVADVITQRREQAAQVTQAIDVLSAVTRAQAPSRT